MPLGLLIVMKKSLFILLLSQMKDVDLDSINR